MELFSLETDDRTYDERSKGKTSKKDRQVHGKTKAPMDTNLLKDHGECASQIRVNLNFSDEIQGKCIEPNEKKFDLERLFDAVSSGDISRLEGLEEYLHDVKKKLTDSEYRPNKKTALMKALLNLRNGDNIVEHLLDIAERMGDLDDLVNAAYEDSYYEGQTALHIAIERRNKHYAELLIQKGADVHAKACGTFFQPLGKTCFYFGELPLSLAACTDQRDIVDLLMDKADVRCKDTLGNTVLHALVMVADNRPENTDFVISMYDYILTKDAARNPKEKRLEDIKNNQGLTSIKLAAKLGMIGLFEHILHREFHQEQCRHLSRKFTEWAYGPVYASLYDLDSIDTYEPNSILEIVVYGTEIPNRLEMLQIEPLKNLLKDKWNRFACWIFLFKFIVYLMYLGMFTAVCFHSEEGPPSFDVWKNSNGKATTHDYLLRVGQIIMVIGSVYFFVTVLMDMKRKRPSLKALLVDGYSELFFLLQAVLFMIYMVLYLAKRQEYLALLVLSLALCWVNLLYFSRGIKHMGIYSVMIQKIILSDILRFLVVYMVFLVGFSAAVVTLLRSDSPDSAQSNHSLYTEVNSTEGCKKPTFEIITFTTLELFKFTIGMGDLEFTEQYEYKHVFYVLLISYIVLTYILLLNMLIALMSKTVTKVSNESTSIWKLQRAIAILDLERYTCCLKTRLRSGVRRNLGRNEEDWRWCMSIFFLLASHGNFQFVVLLCSLKASPHVYLNSAVVEEVNWKDWSRNLGIISEDPGECNTEMQAGPQSTSEDLTRSKSQREVSQQRTNMEQIPLDNGGAQTEKKKFGECEVEVFEVEARKTVLYGGLSIGITIKR